MREEPLNKEILHFDVDKIFPVYGAGIVTARDNLTICHTRTEMFNRIQEFAKMDVEIARSTFKLGEDTRDWQVEAAQKDIRTNGREWQQVVPILYRPFDIRYTYYTGTSRGFMAFPRPEITKNMLFENIGLVTVRKIQDITTFNHCFISTNMIESRLTTRCKGISYLFPLYISPKPGDLKVNIDGSVFFEICRHLGITTRPVPPKTLLYYVYAILFSNQYRKKYDLQLRNNFPQIPFPGNKTFFFKMAVLGEALVKIHFLKSSELYFPPNRFQGGKKPVKYVRYFNHDENKGRVFINETDHFVDIPEEVWNYRLCGYPVLAKYLSKFKDSNIDQNDIEIFSKIILAIEKTIGYQKKIDQLFKCF
jgi:predicted helicase